MHKYLETCCVAGIRLDTDPVRHVRLFPVPHRLLDEEKQFGKYSVVEVDVRRHHADRRPESLRPNLDTLRVVDTVCSRDGWAERVDIARPLIQPSLCAIKRLQAADGTSLGLFRPAHIDSFRLTDASPRTSEQHGIVNQTDVLHPDHRPLEWVPYEFRYRFHCHDDSCRGHDMGLHDWEAGQSWRKFRRTYPAHRLADVLRERWWTRMVTPDRATHFFVGNIAARPRTSSSAACSFCSLTVPTVRSGLRAMSALASPPAGRVSTCRSRSVSSSTCRAAPGAAHARSGAARLISRRWR